MGWKATIAAIVVVSTSAVNELLLTKISELAILNKEVRLNSTYCREGPAASTAALILYWAYSTLISPVEKVWESGKVDGSNLS